MKKKILAALVCASVLSLAGCAGNETSALMNIASKAANENASKPANSTPTKSNGGTSSKTTSTPTSSPASAASSKTSGTSSAPTESKGNDNERLFESDITTGDDGKRYATIYSYKGTSEKVVIPSEINGVTVTDIRNSFMNNIDITSVTIPETVTSIGDKAFAQCINLKEITFLGELPELYVECFEGTPWLEAKKAENPQFLIIGDVLVKAFDFEIKDIVIPDGVTKIAANAFGFNNYYGNNISSITFPDSVTEIGRGAFQNCFNLRSINIPANITKIEKYAFNGCPLRGTVTLPDTIEIVDGLQDPIDGGLKVIYKDKVYNGYDDAEELINTIREKEFDGKDYIVTDNVLMKVRPNITKVELPDTVKSIDDKAFEDCNKSIIITFKGKNYNLANLDRLKAAVSGSTES